MTKRKSSAAKAIQAATATADDRTKLQAASSSDAPFSSVDATQSSAASGIAAAITVLPGVVGDDLPVSDAPSAGGAFSPAVTNSTDTREQSDHGGAGNPAGPAQDAASEVKTIPEDHPYRHEFPRLSAAIDAWRAANPENWPSIVRITSKRDGFRRAGMVHSRTAADYPVETLNRPQLLEQLLAEPMLTVELI